MEMLDSVLMYVAVAVVWVACVFAVLALLRGGNAIGDDDE